MFAKETSNDLPEFIGVTEEQVSRHWDDWLVWRSLGRRNSAGAFEAPVSFVEAMQSVSSEAMNVFMQLDNVYAKMEAQYIAQTSGKK